LLDTSLIEFAAFFYCSSGMCVYFSTWKYRRLDACVEIRYGKYLHLSLRRT
jgi:hypothetical protein